MVILIESVIVDGVKEIKFNDWGEFSEYIINSFYNTPNHYVYRGQEDAEWLLEPSFDRFLKEKEEQGDPHLVAQEHLDSFIKAVRGRRGSNPPEIKNDNPDQWWALGRHYGLYTPLLDWTNSPFVATFFAFEKIDEDPPEYVSISMLRIKEVENRSKIIEGQGKKGQGIKIISPITDENPRMLNQAGLFTQAPYLCDIEKWVRSQYENVENAGILAKFLIPSCEKDHALKVLKNMNIHHLSLFPDLTGASKFCNLKLGLENYHFY